MKIRKEFKFISLIFIIVFCMAILIISKTSIFASAADLKSEDINNIEELFSNREIESSGYLYNYDDSADYIYVNFTENAGYAILANETLEMMEYALSGNIPYENVKDNKKYYGGPNLYFEKENNHLINLLSKEKVAYTEINTNENAQNIRKLFSLQKQDNNINVQSNEIIEDRIKNIKYNFKSSVKSPPLDENNWISPTAGAKYIKNSEYFLTKGAAPRHGINSLGSCTTVATQLLLSYNNYYNDRRIIAPEHLYGEWNASVDNNMLNPQNYKYPNQNVNVCSNPKAKTSNILGSNQAYHDYLYNNGVTSWIHDATNNLKPLLNQRGINFNIEEQHNKTSVVIDSTNIINNIVQGSPVVLATSGTLNGTKGDDAFNHSVIAYGYQEFAPYENDSNSYLGYIVHLGWDNYAIGDKINVWTNSSWYYCYMTLHINHTHNYNISLPNGEARCGECNHRTYALHSYESNDGITISGAAVPFNGHLIIPEIINGKM